MALSGNDTLSVRRTLTAGGREFDFFSLRAAEEAGVGQISLSLIHISEPTRPY